MLHQDDLYCWTGKDLAKIDCKVSNMKYLNDDEFLYKTNNDIDFQGRRVMHSNIYMIEAQFGNYNKRFIYKDKDMRAEILNFGVDTAKKRLIILSGIKN